MGWGKKRGSSQAASVRPIDLPHDTDLSLAGAEEPAEGSPRKDARRRRGENRLPESRAQNALVGPSVKVQGQLSGTEDVFVEGAVEGKIELPEHSLTVRQSGRVEADIRANSVLVEGKIVGNVEADRVEVTATGQLVGDIKADKLVIAEGARFRGNIVMSSRDEHTKQTERAPVTPQSSFTDTDEGFEAPPTEPANAFFDTVDNADSAEIVTAGVGEAEDDDPESSLFG